MIERIPTNLSKYGVLFEVVPTKAQERQLEIIEATIKEFATKGFEKTTFGSIAKRSKISRPLVHHYFASKDELTEMTIKYIRGNFQEFAIRSFKNSTDPREQLKNYIDSTFNWLSEYPAHVRVWLLFYYYCGFDAKYRTINTELVQMGHKRITAILDGGKQAGVFKTKNSAVAAKLIQDLITGSLLGACTENRKTENLSADVYQLSRRIAEGFA